MGNENSVLMNGLQAADLPGGQYWYISPRDGALQFTEGGNATDEGKAFAGQNVTGEWQ
jgi:hypothetical protein